MFMQRLAVLRCACRRCAHPGNLRGKLVSYASLVMRLLPLAQLLLMRFLYFKVGPACAPLGQPAACPSVAFPLMCY
jgi:hypothetical protein